MATSVQSAPRVFRSRPGALSALIVLAAASAWLHWFRHRGDLADEISNRLTALLAVILSLGSAALLLNAALGYPVLILTDEGFTIRSLASKRTYNWSEDYRFEIYETKGFKKISFLRRGSDEPGDIPLHLYRESAEEILQALRDRSRPHENSA
jgi:hypothetical protein